MTPVTFAQNIMLDLYEYLQGTWEFERIIEGHGTAQGMATFKKHAVNPQTLNYQESGIFHNLAQQAFKVHREYIYQFEHEHIHVYHARCGEKTDFFFELLLNTEEQQGAGHHLCVQDHYQAFYQFINTHQFQLNFKVNGPKKDFLIETHYRKTDGPIPS